MAEPNDENPLSPRRTRFYIKCCGGKLSVSSPPKLIVKMATKFHIDKSITWWVTNPAQAKKGTGTGFSRDFVDFIRHISLHCYSRMVDASFGFWEKVIWFCVHTSAACLLIVFLSDAWYEFVQQYFATTLYDPLYPIERVPFPAVSICSNNRISRRAAAKYAEELSKVDPDKRNTTYFMERLLLFGLLYKKDMVEDNPYVYQFQQFLDLYGTDVNEIYFNTLKIMARLNPPCEKILIKCNLAGNPIACLTARSFQTTLTTYGYCCTFNSENIYVSRNRTFRFAQPDLGLTVVLNTSSKDIHFPILRIDGTIVIIHAAPKYPDISSGGSLEVFISNGQDNYLPITPYVVDSVKTLRQYSPKTRNCYFENESPSLYKLGRLQYSFNNCITRCRIKSIIVLCKCLPFNLPVELTPNGTNTVFCTLQHISCLQRYRFKWKSIMSQRLSIPGLERESEDALFCPQCLPSCDDVIYKVSLNTLSVDPAFVVDLPPHDQKDVTVLRVYFASMYTKYYRQIVRNSWFEAFSTIGNYCGIIIGFSLTVVCEVAYFIGRQITLALRQGRQNGHQALTIYP